MSEVGSSASRAWAQLWSDGGGHYGVLYSLQAIGSLVFKVTALHGGATDSALFQGGTAGFTFLAAKANPANQVEWSFEAWNYTGSLNRNGTSHPAVAHVTTYDGSAWFVWAFDDTYYRQSMGRFALGDEVVWVPNSIRDAGPRYTLHVDVAKPMHAHATYIPPEMGPLDDVTWPLMPSECSP